MFIREFMSSFVNLVEFKEDWFCWCVSESQETLTNFFREDFKEKNCIFYDMWQKGRGSTDQNQISEKKIKFGQILIKEAIKKK